jgi:hypothetical protein
MIFHPDAVHRDIGGRRDLDSWTVPVDPDGDDSAGIVTVRGVQQRVEQ